MSDIRIRNFINGEWQDEVNGKRVPLYNPSTGEEIGSVPISGPETAEKAIATAHAACPDDTFCQLVARRDITITQHMPWDNGKRRNSSQCLEEISSICLHGKLTN